MRSNFRDARAWKDCGLEVTNSSDETCKLYDAAISNLVSWGYETHYGSTSEIFSKLKKVSSESVLPQAYMVGLDLLAGQTIYDNEQTKKDVENLMALAKSQENELTDREKYHIAAIDYYSRGNYEKAILEWENVLIDHPTDMHAAHVAFFAMFHAGASQSFMKLCNGIAPFYNKSVPLHEYVNGMVAFGLEEGGHYEKAKKVALDNNVYAPYDTFSYHALAHVFEMTRQLDEGREYIEKTRPHWEVAPHLACHNTWHNTLFYVENLDFEGAMDVYETRLKKYLGPDNFLAYSDVASLFYRLRMAGYDVGKERWRELANATDYYVDSLDRPFRASHILMGALGGDNSKVKQKIVDYAVEMTKKETGHKTELFNNIGLNLMKGICKFHDGDYDGAVDCFRPIRRDLYKIGGSHAQRDVYEMMMCFAALNSNSEHNQNFARVLMAERQASMSSSLTDKMASQLLACHHAND